MLILYGPLVIGETLRLIFQQIHGFLPAAKVEESLAHGVPSLLLLPSLPPEPSEGGDTGASPDHDDGPDWVLGQHQARALGQLDTARHLASVLHSHWSRIVEA